MTRPKNTWSDEPEKSQAEKPRSLWPDEDELPSWKALSSTPVGGANEQTPPDETQRASPRLEPLPPRQRKSTTRQSPPIGALIAASAALLLGTTIGGILVFRGGSDSAESPSANPELSALSPTETDSQATSSPPPTQLAFDEDAQTTEPASSADSAPEDSAPEDSAPEDSVPATDDDEPIRQAVFAGGVIYLRGSVPSTEIGDAIFDRAAAVMGPDNVVNEYVIDPSVTFDPYAGAPLYVQDLVLFPSGSAEIDPQFTPLLDLGIMLFGQNPQVTITVIGHTDSQGNDFDNLALSQERVQAVLNYWTRAGVDPSRITIIGKGEAEPLDDNATSEGRQFNRRVEFIIAGLLAD